MVVAIATASSARADELRVGIELTGGTHYVGEGFELRVAVVGADRRPKVDPPSIAGAEVWLIRHELEPVSFSGIGGAVGGTNVFVSRYRVVARRAGTLQVPSIVARLDDEIGRSRAAQVTVRPVPPEGRPAEFLGGVGRFSIRAEAEPRSVRVGQELTYRITVDGPAAWGMTGRPDLKRFERLPIGLGIRPRPVESTNEPPSRTFTYTLRPTRPGDAVLPAVAIAAFDPASRHYLTRATAAVPIGVRAVPSFDPAVIPDIDRSEEERRTRLTTIVQWAAGSVATLLLAGSATAILWARRRARREGGPIAARRFAAATARTLAHDPADDPPAMALRIIEAMIRFLHLADARPTGAITPDEAHSAVSRHTASDDLATRAAAIVARCDALLYRDVPVPPEDPRRLRDDARALFDRLGRGSSGDRPQRHGDTERNGKEPQMNKD